MRGRTQQGLTLVEIMVSLAVIGVAAALIFGVQMRMTGALRDQQNVAEVQQTLRSAATVISKDVRQAGYLAVAVFEQGNSTTAVQPVQVSNGATGAPDTIKMQSASDGCSARVCDTDGKFCPHHGPNFNASETEVDDNSCFKKDELAYAVRTITVKQDPPAPSIPAGTGCLLYVTHDPQSSAGGNNQKVQHNPAQGAPWNQSGNTQCDPISTVWNDGYTMFMHIKFRSYRIKPNDQRGVLQMSDDDEVTWKDVALGIIDLQLAMRVYHDDANDLDQDGDVNRDWFSGDAMSDLASVVTNPKILMVSVTLVAKTTKDVNGPTLTQVPSLMDPNWPTAALPSGDADHNRLSDKGSVTLPVTDTTNWPSDMYVGDVVYRTFTTTIDLRNIGVGIDGHS